MSTQPDSTEEIPHEYSTRDGLTDRNGRPMETIGECCEEMTELHRELCFYKHAAESLDKRQLALTRENDALRKALANVYEQALKHAEDLLHNLQHDKATVDAFATAAALLTRPAQPSQVGKEGENFTDPR